MATIRMSENLWSFVHKYLFSVPGEHFAFLLARWTFSNDEPVFLVHDAEIIPDDQVEVGDKDYQISIDGIIQVVNKAVHSGDALIEVHNHGGKHPRFSITDRQGFREFVPYLLESLPGRPYAATVWGESIIYGEYFLPDGRTGSIHSMTVVGSCFQQLSSREDEGQLPVLTFDRQLPWFTYEGQRRLSRIKVGIVGVGGTGSQVIQNLVYLGVRDFVLVDHDEADQTNLNRLVTATAADVGTPKGILGRRLIKSIAPNTSVAVIGEKLQSAGALDALKGVDVIFGCLDNDGGRLILNELALAYGIPYLDLGVGIKVEGGTIASAGGRVVVILPGGPCLNCMGEIDIKEAQFHLSNAKQQVFQLERGYVEGADIKTPSVVSLNATIAAVATNEFAVFVSGIRPVNVYTDIDLLGAGRPVKSQWMTPRLTQYDNACVQCIVSGIGDATGIERYTL